MSKGNGRYLLGIAGLACAYFVAGKLGLSLSLVVDNVTLIWPPSGLALATLLLFGRRYWPGVLLGALSVNLTTSIPGATAVAIALGNTGEALAGYWLLTRLAPIDLKLPHVRDALRLILLGGGVASMVSASVGVASLVLGGVIPAEAATKTWSIWWMGDAMGAIVFGSVLLAWVHNPLRRLTQAWMIEAMVFLGLVLLIALISVGGISIFSHTPPLAFLAMPMLVWGAARFGHRGVTIAVLIFTLAALWGVLAGTGLFKRASAAESLSLLWIYANVLAMSGLMLAAYLRQLSEAQSGLRLAASVFEQMPMGIAISDPRGYAISVNPAYLNLMGFTQQDVLGKDLRQSIAPQHTQAEIQHLESEALAQGYWAGELWKQKASGEIFPTWTTLALAHDAVGQLTHYIVSVTDITERKQIEAHNRDLAEHDALTGLPNRMLLADRLRQAIRYATRQQVQVALLFVDLDHFKVINDSLGHDVGDELLKLLATRLSACVREEDTVARLGGDEFVIIVNLVQHDSDVAFVAQKILDAVAQPYQIGSYTLDITASIGIAVYPRDGHDVGTLLKHADLAMYQGKIGRANYHFYGAEMDRHAQARLSIEGKLRRALENNEFLLFYQPQVDAQSGAVVGVEALIRWRLADGSMIPPGEFIAIAEETGLILPIGSWVLQEAARQTKLWQAQGLSVPRIAVNVSARQIWHGGLDFEVQRTLEQAGVDPGIFELELTESVFLRSSEDVTETFSRLDQVGVRLAIDDFGTGYSSLGYLRRLPVDTLKLDRSFVQDLPQSKAAGAIASAVISLAKGLGMSVVAEGVETAAQHAYLLAQGCHQLQGFYFSQPLPANECAEVLRGGFLQGSPLP